MPGKSQRTTFDSVTEVVQQLELQSCPEIWQTSWKESSARFKNQNLPFPSQSLLARASRTIRFSAPVEAAIHEAAGEIAANPALQQLAWHCYWLLFESKTEQLATSNWPQIPRSPLFYAIVLLSGLKQTLARHTSRNIDPEITSATLTDLELWIRHYHDKHGRWGLAEFNWLRNHFEGKLFALGRLQFEFSKFAFDYRLLQCQRTRRLVLLADPRIAFDAAGQCIDKPDNAKAAAADSPTDDQHFVGKPIYPTGHGVEKIIRLPRAEWHQILGKGDPTMAIHIPATGPMSHDECGKSMLQARSFFPEHFPDRPYAAFTCHSWLLDSQFEDHLPAHSNIVRFLREMYLFPVPGASDKQTMERIFGEKPDNLSQAPRDTSLRRAVLDHMVNGGSWRDAGGLIVPDQLAWGDSRYRQEFSLD